MTPQDRPRGNRGIFERSAIPGVNPGSELVTSRTTRLGPRCLSPDPQPRPGRLDPVDYHVVQMREQRADTIDHTARSSAGCRHAARPRPAAATRSPAGYAAARAARASGPGYRPGSRGRRPRSMPGAGGPNPARRPARCGIHHVGHVDGQAGPRRTTSRDQDRLPAAGSCRRSDGRWRGRCSRTDGRRESNHSWRLFHTYLRSLRDSRNSRPRPAIPRTRNDYTIVVHV
jgi:hypothetical protein